MTLVVGRSGRDLVGISRIIGKLLGRVCSHRLLGMSIVWALLLLLLCAWLRLREVPDGRRGTGQACRRLVGKVGARIGKVLRLCLGVSSTRGDGASVGEAAVAVVCVVGGCDRAEATLWSIQPVPQAKRSPSTALRRGHCGSGRVEPLTALAQVLVSLKRRRVGKCAGCAAQIREGKK